MKKKNGRLHELIDALPPDAQKEVEDFAEFLLQKKRTRKQHKLRMDWAGGLREYRDRYTSLQLQQKALEWWGD